MELLTKRPEGMDFHLYRALLRMQQVQLKARKNGQPIPQPKGLTAKEVEEIERGSTYSQTI